MHTLRSTVEQAGSGPRCRLYNRRASAVLRAMTRYEAFVESSWREQGLAYVLVARIKEANVEIGCFMVDWWCLGVKDAVFIDSSTEAGLAEIVAEQMPTGNERMHPACAKKLINGAIAYAEKFGFAPHRDFRKARRVLSGVDATDCPETFEYGREGRPCYVEGPHDSPARVEKVLALLEARLGPGGFDFVAYDDGTDEDLLDVGHASDVLYDFIVVFPAPAFGTFAEFSGLAASLHVCPKHITVKQTLALFLHPGHPAWTTKEEAQEVAGSFAVYWSHTGLLLASSDEDEEESYVIDLHKDDETEPLPRIFSLWCRGFMRSFELWPEAWADALRRPELEPHFSVLRSWAEAGDAPAAKPYPPEDDAEDQITAAVIALYRTFKPDRKSVAKNGPQV